MHERLCGLGLSRKQYRYSPTVLGVLPLPNGKRDLRHEQIQIQLPPLQKCCKRHAGRVAGARGEETPVHDLPRGHGREQPLPRLHRAARGIDKRVQ